MERPRPVWSNQPVVQRTLWSLALVALLGACSDGAGSSADAGRHSDASAADARLRPGRDAAAPDGSEADAGITKDAQAEDALGSADAGVLADAGTACDPATMPVPARCAAEGFTPDSPTVAWSRGTTGTLVVTQGSPRHRCVDRVANPGQDTVLIGKFTYGTFDKDLKGEKVEVWLRGTGCAWTKLGTEVTSENGDHGTVAGVTDDGGRVFHGLPAASLPGPGIYAIKMLVKGDHSSADCNLFVWPRGTQVVVSDLDGTITTQETDGFASFFDPTSPTPRPSAQETLDAWASKNARILYLTARPEMFTSGTRAWLEDHGFPFGLLHLSQTNIGELGAGAIDYKAGTLEDLARDHGVVLAAAYGNKDTDLAAYLSTAVPAHEIRLFGFEGDLMGAQRIDDYAPEAQRVSCLSVTPQP